MLYDVERPDDFTLEEMDRGFNLVVEEFLKFRHLMPNSVVRQKGKGKSVKQRKNIISYSYIMRKQLERLGVWKYHNDLPLFRTWTKIHALDDIYEVICDSLYENGYTEFQWWERSTVIKRPKLKLLK